MKRNLWIAASLVVACVLGAAAWRALGGAGDSEGEAAAPLPASARQAPPESHGSAPALSRTPPMAASADPRLGAPLPALDEPLRLALPELQRRAAAGEGAASCRLAAELARCEGLRTRLGHLEVSLLEQQRIRDVAPPNPHPQSPQAYAAHVDALGEATDQLLRELQHCEGVPPASPATIARHWRSAAHAGHLPSMTQYAVGNAFRRNRVLDTLPALQVYRREAEDMARRAAAAGSMQALLALAAAYAPVSSAVSGTFLAQVVEPDPVEAQALYLHIQSVLAADPEARTRWQPSIAHRIAEIGTTLAPSQRSRASRRAAELQAQWRRPASLAGINPTTLRMGWVGDMSRVGCGDTLPSAPRPEAPRSMTSGAR